MILSLTGEGTRGGVVVGQDDPGGGPAEGDERPAYQLELLVIEDPQQLAHLAGVELTEAVDERGTGGREPDDDLAAVGGIIPAGGEPVVHHAVHETADGGQGYPEAGHQVRHVEVAGGTEEVQELRLGHRDVDLQELRRVAVGEALHEHLVASDDLIDGVGALGGCDGSGSFGCG